MTTHLKSPLLRCFASFKAVALLCALACLSASAQQDNAPTAVADEILVQPKSHLSEQAAKTLFSIHGAREVSRIPQINVRVLKVPAVARDRVLQALQNNPNIEFAELNGLGQIDTSAPNDPEFVNGRQWHLAKVQAPQAWNMTTGNANSVIAILDSGVAPNHPDLVGKLEQGFNFVANNNNWADDHGHGTQVAGVAAAQGNNGIGVAGVAWNASILPVKIVGSTGTTTISLMANGITYSADRAATVINLSCGTTTASSTLQNAVNYAWNKNATVVASAGNYGNNTPVYPAACLNVIGVAALDPLDIPATWSNFGSYVDLTAPGSGIYTTKIDGSYCYVSGTSFSSPLVAGVVALVVAAKPNLNNTTIVNLLLNNADDLGAPGYDIYNGFGRVNAYRSVLAAGGPIIADVTAPTTSITSPGAGSTIAGSVTVNTLATDDTAVTRVDMYLNGSLQGTSTQIPASFNWDTTASSNGAPPLRAQAYDAAGNVGTSANVTVTVQNLAADVTPPTAWITSPIANSTVSKTTKVYAGSSDDRGVARVELYANGAFVGTSTSPSPVFNWNTAKISRGAYILQVVAFDAAGNAGSSAPVTVFK